MYPNKTLYILFSSSVAGSLSSALHGTFQGFWPPQRPPRRDRFFILPPRVLRLAS